MKYIIKNQELQELSTWKNLSNSDWHPDYEDLSGKEKKAVKTALRRNRVTFAATVNAGLRMTIPISNTSGPRAIQPSTLWTTPTCSVPARTS